jgi:hypothetical protein
MTLPMEVLNRLRLGKDVAARVAPEHPGFLAWVYVYPFLDPDEAFWLQGRIYRTGSGNPIRGYLVRHVEAEPEVVEEFYRADQDDLSRTAVDVIFEVSTEEELALALGRWMSDFASLGDPRGAEYWFASGAQLVASRASKACVRNREYREIELQPQILTKQKHLVELSEDCAEYEDHRRQLKQLAESWRRSVRAGGGWHQGTSFRTAARMLGIDETGLIHLIDWGLLTACEFPEQIRCDGQPLVLLGDEIHCLLAGESTMDDEPLPVDEIWWRGLVDLEP